MAKFVPSMLTSDGYSPFRKNRCVYATFVDMYRWAQWINRTTEEGEPYHDCLDTINNAFKAIGAFFDGSKGTYVDPLTQQTVNWPEICTWQDILDLYCDEYNTRLLEFSTAYLDDTDWDNQDEINQFYGYVLGYTAGRIQRFCKFNKMKYEKLIKTMNMQYNPIADYWTRSKELEAEAPYITISNPSSGEFGTVSGWNSDSSHSDGYKTETTNKADTEVKNQHYTTTFDSSASNRLESYDVQTGGTKNTTTNSIPNSGSFRKREEEGNKGTMTPQQMIEKEYDIAYLWDLVHLFAEDLNKLIFLSVYMN